MSLKDLDLWFLDGNEMFLIENPAKVWVSAKVHNELVHDLLCKLARERQIVAAYERSALPLRRALEVY